MPLLSHAAYVQAREAYFYVDTDVTFDVVQTGREVTSTLNQILRDIHRRLPRTICLIACALSVNA